MHGSRRLVSPVPLSAVYRFSDWVWICLVFVVALTAFPQPLSWEPPVSHIGERTEMVSRQQVIEMEITAYTSSIEDCGKDDGITATGSKAGPGTLSADWRLFPPGTRMEIPGYGRGVVSDRGGGIRGNRLDVWLPDAESVKNYGRQRLEVKILEGDS